MVFFIRTGFDLPRNAFVVPNDAYPHRTYTGENTADYWQFTVASSAAPATTR